MRSRLNTLSALSPALVGVAVLLTLQADDRPAAPSADLEIRRIRSHLAQVEGDLRARSTQGLTPPQRSRRLAALSWLREYREAGRFPHNHTHADRRVPVFVDEHGTPCAVGYLLLRSGAADLVDDVVGSSNNAYVPELAGAERFVAWLEDTGLTVEEAARIQPAYGPSPPPPATESTVYETGTVLLGVASAFTTGFSIFTAPDPLRPELLGGANAGLAFVHTAMAVGGAFGDDNATWAVAVNGGLALISTFAAIQRFNRREYTSAVTASRSRDGVRVIPELARVGRGTGLQLRIAH